MNRSVPEWVENPTDCPADGCEGSWWRDVAGSVARPKKVRETTCEHRILSCANCGEEFAEERGTGSYEWATEGRRGGPGGWRQMHFCKKCHTRRNVYETVPWWALMRPMNRERIPGDEL